MKSRQGQQLRTRVLFHPLGVAPVQLSADQNRTEEPPGRKEPGGIYTEPARTDEPQGKKEPPGDI